MSRGPIPDKPAARPTVPEVAALVERFSSKSGNEIGGVLHVVIDDGNLADHNIHACLRRAQEARDELGEEIARKLLAMTPTQRKRVYKQRFAHPGGTR